MCANSHAHQNYGMGSTFLPNQWEGPTQLGRNISYLIAPPPHTLYRIPMDTIERELLHRIITDRPFAEYITQRIDIGDFDDDVANRIYDGIVDLLCQEQRISYEVLKRYFNNDLNIVEALERSSDFDGLK